jgi:hypothetical protein
MLTREYCSKLRSFVALLCICLIDCTGEFPNKQLKLQYTFSRLEGAVLEQIIHVVKDNWVNLKNVDTFITLLEEAY